MNSRVAAIVLAAGQSTRMGANKLLLPVDGVPMIVRSVDAALYSQAFTALTVVGFEAQRIVRLLSDCTTHIVHNNDYESGMASSIHAGVNALPAGIDAALILLGDMPYVTATELDALIEMHNAHPDAIGVPMHAGQRGNPVLWPRAYFPRLLELTGDIGARELLTRFAHRIRPVEFDTPAVLRDCDTPDMLPPPKAPETRYSKRY